MAKHSLTRPLQHLLQDQHLPAEQINCRIVAACANHLRLLQTRKALQLVPW